MRLGEDHARVYHVAVGSRASGRAPGRPAGFLARLGRCEHGQSVVEFAMVMVPFAALVLILLQFGKAVYYYIDLTHVANEGARIATVSPTKMPDGTSAPGALGSYLCGFVSTAAGGGKSELATTNKQTDRAQITVSYPANNNNSPATTRGFGDPVTVKVATVYHWLPFWNLSVTSLNIVGSATMRLEQSAVGNPALDPGPTTCG
jgi:Flp pilus assembly protein TadG